MAEIHEPILQRMRFLSCQQSDTVIWWERQSLWRWCTKKNDVKNTQPFVIKSDDSIKDHPNDNGPNAKMKSLYNVAKSVWTMNYGITKFSPHHMNYVLVEAWDAFNISAGNIIRDSFSKKSYPSLALQT